MIKEPKVLSALGLAASIALVATLLLPWGAGPSVEAAVIIGKLNEQIEKTSLIEVTIESLNVDEFRVNGRLQISELGVAGDIEATVREEGQDHEIEVNVSLGLSDTGGWIFIRDLKIDDPQVQGVINIFFPAGQDALIVFPEKAMGSGLNLGDELAELGSEKVVAVLQKLIDARANYAATIEFQSDDSILLTLPLDDAEVLAALERLLREFESNVKTRNAGTNDEPGGEMDVVAVDDEERTVHVDKELLGSTLTIVYDPTAEVVRSFCIENLGSAEGKITVTIGEGEIDPALLDSSRVTTPQTRVLDVSTLQSMFGNFKLSQ